MPLVTVIIALIVVGILLWAVNAYVPLDPKIKRIINIVVVVAVVIWLLRVFGVWGHIDDIKVGQIISNHFAKL